MKSNENNRLAALMLALFCALAQAEDSDAALDKEINAVLNDVNQSISELDTQQSQNCSNFEAQADLEHEEAGNSIKLKQPLILERFGTEIRLAAGDNLSYAESALHKKPNKNVRVKFVRAGKKGSGFLPAGELQALVKAHNNIPASCLK